MSKLRKRILALFLAVVMAVGCGILPASAEGNETPSQTTYYDGVYQGSGIGYASGEIVVNVTVSGGEIEKIELVSQEGQSYWESCDLASLFPKMVTANSADVDVIAGATESSEGVKAAVKAALEKASVAPEEPAANPIGVLTQNINTTDSALVSYAGQQWNVIGYNGQGVAAGDGNFTLLLKGTLGATGFNSMSDYDSNEYGSSQYYRAISRLITSTPYGIMTNINFSDSERSAIVKRTLETGSYQADGSCDGVAGSPVADQLVWPLSTKEATQVDAALRILNPENTKDAATTRWWLRSPGQSEFYAATVGSDGTVIAAGKAVSNSQAFRPAFNLNAESIALVLAADTASDGANGLAAVAENTANTWKLTLKDSAHSTFTLGDMVVEDNQVSVAYSGAATGEKEYISAAVINGSTVKYYGHVKALSGAEDAAGTAVISLEGITLADNDQLYVFNELDNGAQANNAGSALYEINLTSKDKPAFTQQPVSVTVEEGGFAEFKVLASGDPEPEYAWQVNSGNGWVDIEDADDYDYSISKVSLSQNGYKFRCVATNSHGSAYSNSATLTVTERQLANYVISAQPNVKAWGTVSGTGIHVEGTEVTLKAAANSGYEFVSWLENDQQVSTDAEYTFTASGNRSLTAVFQDVNAPGKSDYQNIYQGSGLLGENANTAAAATLWYGGQKWVVIGYEGTGVVSAQGNMTLLAADAIGSAKFSDGETAGAYYGNEYAKSALKTAVDAIADGFTAPEKSYIQARDLAAGTHGDGWPYDDVIKGDAVEGALLWPLSPYEVSNDSVSLNSTLKKLGAEWWLRSAGSGSYYAAIVTASGMTNAGGTTVNKSYAVRPAFLLNTADILFTTSTSGGKASNGVGSDALTAAQGTPSDSWKLTMHNAAYDTFTVGDMLRNGDDLTISYTGAITGENMYISAVVKSSDGTVKAYGRLAQLSAGMENGEVSLNLANAQLASGDTLYLFNEQYNGSYSTDLSSALREIAVPKLEQEAFAFSDSQVNKTYGDPSFTAAATGAAQDSVVTYSSSDETVATVDPATGAVTIHNAGTAVITAAAAATDSYNAATAQYTLTVAKAALTVTVHDMNLVTWDALPDLTQGDLSSYYTVSGLVNGDQLSGAIKLSYQQDGKDITPSMKVAGTYAIAASGAASPANGNYEDIVYRQGKLTVAKKTVAMPFEDVVAGEYYEDAVYWAVDQGITKGTTETTFEPESFCTRAHAITFLWRAAGCPAPKSTTTAFTDVDPDAYYYPALLWATENGIVLGTSDTTFSPDMVCSRAHFVTFLWRENNKPQGGTENPFTDVPSGAYYEQAVLWAAKEHIVLGTSETAFSPDDSCTRGQAVTFLYRAS